MNRRIVVLGLGQNNFLSYLYSVLKIHHQDYSISAPFFSELNTEKKDESWMYDNQNIIRKPRIPHFLKAVVSILLNKYTYIFFHYILFVEGKGKKAFHFLYSFFKEQSFLYANDAFKTYDIAHFHFMQYSYVRSVFLLPSTKKIVCSFWGSDLLRTSDNFNHFIIQKVLSRANAITCQTPEMKEIILSKFGRNLEKKIKLCLFPLDRLSYDNIDLYRNDNAEIEKFKKDFGFHLTKKNILIGHNGNASNQQIEVIQSLLDLKTINDYHLIINLNYGCPPQEITAFKNALETLLKSTQTTFYINEIFYNKKELALSRLATDIFIHVPISDALSGSMLEMLYANTTVITGTWLNYKTFKKAHLDYFEVEAIRDIPYTIEKSCLESDRDHKVSNNQRNIITYFNNAILIENWHNTFQEL